MEQLIHVLRSLDHIYFHMKLVIVSIETPIDFEMDKYPFWSTFCEISDVGFDLGLSKFKIGRNQNFLSNLHPYTIIIMDTVKSQLIRAASSLLLPNPFQI